MYPILGVEVVKNIKVSQPLLMEAEASSIWRTLLAKLEVWDTPADRLFNRLNYTCLSYLTSIKDPLKRAFYEQETIRGCWTSRELDRQVSSEDDLRKNMLEGISEEDFERKREI